jgi:hypothetical protein
MSRKRAYLFCKEGDIIFMELLVLNQYNKFIKLLEKDDAEEIDYEQPYNDRWNVFKATPVLEEFCNKNEISFMKLSVEEYKLMNGLNF